MIFSFPATAMLMRLKWLMKQIAIRRKTIFHGRGAAVAIGRTTAGAWAGWLFAGFTDEIFFDEILVQGHAQAGTVRDSNPSFFGLHFFEG